MNSIDKKKILLKFTSNFLKMLAEESCQNIKVKFWVGLEDQIKNIGLENDELVKIIFEEILNKNNEILTNKNLMFCMTNFLRGKSQKVFDNCFLNLVFKLLQNYEQTETLFNDFLGELIFNLYIINTGDNNKFYSEFSDEIIEKIKKLFFSFIDFDQDLFTLIMKNNIEIENDYIFVLHHNKEYSEIFNYFIEKLIKEKYEENLIFFLEKIEEFLSHNHSCEGINNLARLFENICNVFLNQNSNINPNEETLDLLDKQNFILILTKVLKNIHKLIDLIKNDKSNLEKINENFLQTTHKFLILILENINSSKKIFFSNINILMKFYNNSELQFTNFRNLFLLTLYSFIDEIYDMKSLKIYENLLSTIKSMNYPDTLNIILSELISKVVILNQQTRYFDKSNFNNNKKVIYSFKISPEYDHSTANIKNLTTFYHSSNLNLVDYIVSNIFSLKKEKEKESDNIIVNFHEYNFIHILDILAFLKLENYNSKYQNFISKLILRIILFFYEGIYIKNIETEKIPNYQLFEIIFSNLNKNSDKEFLKSEIYPLIITFIQAVIFPNFIYFSNNIKILDLFFNFLFEFYRHDNITNLTSKLLMSLFNLKIEVKEIDKSNKIYALNKFAELVEKINSSKIFTQFFNFCTDNLKNEENTQTVVIIYNSINKFCSKYEGALQNSLLDFVFTKFEKCFDLLPEKSNFEALFSLSAIYEILVKDQPERVVNKIYESFYNKKFLRILDKFFKELSLKEDEIISNIFEKDSNLKYEHINKNLENLNISNLILKNKLDNDHISFAILLNMSKIFSLFISNIIFNNKDHFDIKTLSDQNNKTIISLLQTFDYITNGILFSEGPKTHSQLIFLNEFFGHSDNLNFFYNTHSYYMAINHIEKKNLDLSQLKEINTIINRDKNREFINFMRLNENSVFLMKILINNILNYEGNYIYLYESKKYSALSDNNNKLFVIDSLYDNSTLKSISTNEILTGLNEKKSMAELFVKALLEMLYTTETDVSNLKLNENIYLFLLHHNILMKYFRNIHDLLNLDLILLNFYNVVKKHKNITNTVNFFNFLLFFSKINKNVFQFSLRIILNKKIFHNVLLHDKKIIIELFNLISYLFNQVIFYSSYKNESLNYIITILDNIELSIYNEVNGEKISNCLNMNNLTFFGKMILEIFSLMKIHIDETSHTQIEINKKFKDSLIQILADDSAIKYINNLLITPFNERENIKIIQNNMFNYLQNLDILNNLKSSKIINEKNLSKILKENPLLENCLLFQEITFTKTLYQILINYCGLLKNSDSNPTNKIYIDIIENYIFYQIIYKNNEKLLQDISKNLLFNKDFNKNITWDEKYKLISMMLLTLLKDSPGPRIFEFRNNHIMKNLGTFLNVNILKMTGVGRILVSSIGDINLIDEESKDYFKIIKKMNR